MPSSHRVEFANFVVTTENENLVDMFDALVWPAFNDTSERKGRGGGATFFVHECRGYIVMNGKQRNEVVVGRFVKNTTLSREQYFKGGQMIEDPMKIPSSPSAVFLLHLRSHKLVYVHETPHAPTLAQLEMTIAKSVAFQREQIVQAAYARSKANEQPTTLAVLRAQNPMPTIDIIPLSSDVGLEKFLKSFDLIKKIHVRLVKSNHEIESRPFFDMLRKQKAQLKAERSVITQSSAEGLDPAASNEYVSSATAQANAKVEIIGTDDDGDELKGDNNEFSIKTSLARVPKKLHAISKRLMGEFLKQVDADRIKLPKEDGETQKAEAIADHHNWHVVPLNETEDDE